MSTVVILYLFFNFHKFVRIRWWFPTPCLIMKISMAFSGQPNPRCDTLTHQVKKQMSVQISQAKVSGMQDDLSIKEFTVTEENCQQTWGAKQTSYNAAQTRCAYLVKQKYPPPITLHSGWPSYTILLVTWKLLSIWLW